MAKLGRWYGDRLYFGLHYDLHANAHDAQLGTRCSELAPMLQRMGVQFVQTDCKGHPGYTSWFSKTPSAAVAPGLKKDALKQWRAATRKLGLPLHCHYSGIWDKAQGEKHPDWCVVPADVNSTVATGQNAGAPVGEKMCPRGPYLEEFLIPQLLELIDSYEVDGFWIDGDLWSVEPCYCPRCRKAWTEKTGIAQPPTEVQDPNWPAWWTFTLESFERYVTRYCDAVHQHKPGVLVCSNWLQTFANPGEPKVPTDWISGDNSWVWGLDGSRCEARFLSTRNKHWDIMLWNFYCSHGMGLPDSPWVAKPVEMLTQEAAVLLSFGGHVQVYENPGELRDGRLIPWRQQRMAEVGRFVKARRALCQNSQTIPQVAVLHSEHHIRGTTRGKNLMWSPDTAPVRGATFALLENHFGVDIMDEWALLPRLAEFPVVVAPEQHEMSADMLEALKQYVRQGGKLLVSGAESFDRFGAQFLGVTAGKVVEKATHHVPAADGSVPLYSHAWRLVKPKGANVLKSTGKTPLLDDGLLPNPSATLHKVGKGLVAYIPAAVFRDFHRNRYPLTRAFVGEVTRQLAGKLDIEVKAPLAVDVAFRRKGALQLVHLVNRISGIPNQANNGAIDQVPPIGPIEITIKATAKPKSVRLAFERSPLAWTFRPGLLKIRVERVQIHAAVVVERKCEDAAQAGHAGAARHSGV